jgi:beta-glucosidase-like glycosyl hydrolase
LAATFDLGLAHRIGKALAEETLTKGANVLYVYIIEMMFRI